MTNLEKWKQTFTPKDFANFYNDLTRNKGCTACPLTFKCRFVNEETCKDKLLDFATEENTKK